MNRSIFLFTLPTVYSSAETVPGLFDAEFKFEASDRYVQSPFGGRTVHQRGSLCLKPVASQNDRPVVIGLRVLSDVSLRRRKFAHENVKTQLAFPTQGDAAVRH